MSTAILPIVYVVPEHDARRGDCCARSCRFRRANPYCLLFDKPLKLRPRTKTKLMRLEECKRAEQRDGLIHARQEEYAANAAASAGRDFRAYAGHPPGAPEGGG